MIPHPKGGQSLDDVFNNRSEWMLLDRSRISFDGSECDKVCEAVGFCLVWPLCAGRVLRLGQSEHHSI